MSKEAMQVPEQGDMDSAPIGVQAARIDQRETLRRFTTRAAITVAVAQAAVLGIAAQFAALGHVPTILQHHDAVVDIAAWRAPAGGLVGAGIVVLELLSILVGIAMSLRCGRVRHVGHAILTGWIAFWLYRMLALAVTIGGAEQWAMVAPCSVAAGCQLVAWKLGPKPVST